MLSSTVIETSSIALMTKEQTAHWSEIEGLVTARSFSLVSVLHRTKPLTISFRSSARAASSPPGLLWPRGASPPLMSAWMRALLLCTLSMSRHDPPLEFRMPLRPLGSGGSPSTVNTPATGPSAALHPLPFITTRHGVESAGHAPAQLLQESVMTGKMLIHSENALPPPRHHLLYGRCAGSPPLQLHTGVRCCCVEAVGLQQTQSTLG